MTDYIVVRNYRSGRKAPEYQIARRVIDGAPYTVLALATTEETANAIIFALNQCADAERLREELAHPDRRSEAQQMRKFAVTG